MQKIIGFIISGIVILFLGYLIGSFFPISGFFGEKDNIAGNAGLKVTVLRPDKTPAVNLEVDISEEAGKVNTGGHELTDANGVATFKVKPGTYSIFFNSINFPKNLQFHETPQVILEDGQTATYTINLQPQS